MELELISKAARKVVAEFPEISLVYLFGSQITGNIGPLSDIDLGILIDREKLTAELQGRLAHEFACALGTDRIDVIILNRAPIELAFSIIAQGVLLFERKIVEKVEYEATVMSMYYDYLPILREQREDIVRGDTSGKRVQWYREAFKRTERTLREIAASKNETST